MSAWHDVRCLFAIQLSATCESTNIGFVLRAQILKDLLFNKSSAPVAKSADGRVLIDPRLQSAVHGALL